MATALTTYKVITPVQRDKYYKRGASIELSDEDAAPLLALGAIGVGVLAAAVAVSPAMILGASTVAKMTVLELQDYAKLHGVALNAEWTKDQIVTAITAAKADVEGA